MGEAGDRGECRPGYCGVTPVETCTSGKGSSVFHTFVKFVYKKTYHTVPAEETSNKVQKVGSIESGARKDLIEAPGT